MPGIPEKRDFSWPFGALFFGILPEKLHNFKHTVGVQVKVVLWVSMHKCMVIGCKNIFQERKLARFESSGLSVHIKVETVFLNCSILQFFNYFGMRRRCQSCKTRPKSIIMPAKSIIFFPAKSIIMKIPAKPIKTFPAKSIIHFPVKSKIHFPAKSIFIFPAKSLFILPSSSTWS